MDFLWALSKLRTPFLESLFGTLTHLGEEAVVIALLCALYWCFDKALTYRVGIAYFMAGLLVQGLKITFRIERPWVLDPNFPPVESALGAATGYSFPSGHTQSAVCLYGTLGLRAKPVWLRVLCFALAALVGFSRMLLGVHTPKDVLTALALSAAIVALVELFCDRLVRRARADTLFSLAMLAASAALIVYAGALYRAGTVALGYVSDCCKAAGAGAGFAVGGWLERRYIRFDPRAARPAMQAVKYLFGLAVTLGLKAGLKPLLGASPAADAIRYLLVVLWVMALYPLLIKHCRRGARRAGNADA